MARYSIEDTTLTAIGDAIRNKTKRFTRIETVTEDVYVPAMQVSKTSNATSFTTWEGTLPNKNYYEIVKFEGASKIKVKIGWQVYSSFYYVSIKEGAATTREEYIALNGTEKTYKGDSNISLKYQEDIFNGDTITFFWLSGGMSQNYLGYYAECIALDADGNEMGGGMVEKTYDKEVVDTMTPVDMPAEIDSIVVPNIPDSAFNLTGNVSYRFCSNGWDWFIEEYKDSITTKDLTDTSYMFQNSGLTSVPFDLNGVTDASKRILISHTFASATKLTEIPKIKGRVDATNNLFHSCSKLVELKEEDIKDIDWSYVDSQTSAYNCNRSNTFYSCNSLRRFPMSFLAHGNPVGTYSYSLYGSLFYNCYVLDEVIGLPIVHRNASWTSNAFSSTFNYCHRLKDIIFETNEDGSPIKIDTWSKQTIDLSYNVGYTGYASYMTSSGLTTATEVKDDATYQALKDNPDWWTTKIDYCRYNHDSAVRTINSLPDLSAKGGNTIKFKGAAGALTDGGAINTLTAEEIAVATAKGWTVTLA